MQAFMVLHVPTGKFLTPSYLTKRKSEILRKGKGTVFLDESAARGAITSACNKHYQRASYPAVMQGSTRSDFVVKPVTVSIN